jgi:hypothetical protein
VLEVVLADRHAVEDFGVDHLVLNVNEVHLFADALHRGLRAERGNVGPDKSVRLARNGLGFDIVVELHVAGVDPEHLEAAVLVGDANVDLAVEPSEPTEGWVDRVGAVGCANDHHRRPLLEAVHKGEHLRNDSALDLPVGLLSLGGDRVDLVDEDDGGGVLLGLLEGLSEVGLGLAGHLGHDFRPVDEEEEGPGFVGDGAGDQGLSRPRRPVQEDPAGRLDPERLEEGGVPERELDHFSDLRHLLAAAADVVVPDVVHLLFVLALDGIPLAVDDGVGSDDAVRRRVGLDDLELDGVHRRPDQKEVALLDGTVRLQKVRLEVDVKQVARNALDGVVQRQNVDPLPVRDVPAAGDRHNIRQPDPQVLAHALVHPDAAVVARLVGQDDAHGVPSLLALDEDRVSAEQLELLHLGRTQGNDGVVVVGGVVHDQPVGAPLLAGPRAAGEDRLLHLFVFPVAVGEREVGRGRKGKKEDGALA